MLIEKAFFSLEVRSVASSWLRKMGFSCLPQEFDERWSAHPFVALLQGIAEELSAREVGPFEDLPWDGEVPREALRFLLHLMSDRGGEPG